MHKAGVAKIGNKPKSPVVNSIRKFLNKTGFVFPSQP